MKLRARNENKLVDVVLKLLLFGGGLFVAKRLLNSLAENAQAEKLGTDLPTQQAQLLRAAMNRSGVGLFSWADGTDFASILATAKQIKDWTAVVRAYNNLYHDNLADDLTGELSTDELSQFYRAIGQQNLASNYLTEFAIKNGFKYRVGQQLKSKPAAAGSNITNYYSIKTDANGKKTLKVEYKNTLPNTLLGTVATYRVQKVLENGKASAQRMYLVGNIPGLSPTSKYFVFERDTTR